MEMDEQHNVVYDIFKLFRKNAIIILMTIRTHKKIRWTDMKKITKLSTPTFNRALNALTEVNFIKKEKQFYMLTWTGKLVTDGLVLFGVRLSEEIDDIEDSIAEKLLAKDIVMVILFLLFVSLKKRGKLNLIEFKKEINDELKIIDDIITSYENEGFLKRKDGWIYPTDKIKKLDYISLFK